MTLHTTVHTAHAAWTPGRARPVPAIVWHNGAVRAGRRGRCAGRSPLVREGGTGEPANVTETTRPAIAYAAKTCKPGTVRGRPRRACRTRRRHWPGGRLAATAEATAARLVTRPGDPQRHSRPPARAHLLPAGAGRARIVWQDDGDEFIETVAAGWSGQNVYVRLPDRRYRLTSVWLDAADVTRR
jgi:hypothetical protein